MLVCIKAFLTVIRQRVVVNSALSPWIPLTSGVIQGTVLGPLQFTLFVSDIPSMLSSLQSRQHRESAKKSHQTVPRNISLVIQ